MSQIELEKEKPVGETGLSLVANNALLNEVKQKHYSLAAVPKQWHKLKIWGLMKCTTDRSIAKTPCAIDGRTSANVFNTDNPATWNSLELVEDVCAALNKSVKDNNTYFTVACIIQGGYILFDQDDSARNDKAASKHSQEQQRLIVKKFKLKAYRSTSGKGSHSPIACPLWEAKTRYDDGCGYTADIKLPGSIWALPGELLCNGEEQLTKTKFAELSGMFGENVTLHDLQYVTNRAGVKADDDKGDEFDPEIINRLMPTTAAQLHAPATSTNAALGEFASLTDGSARFRRVAIELVRVSKNLYVALRILSNSVMGHYENRTRGQQPKNELQYHEWLKYQIAKAGDYCIAKGYFEPFMHSLSIDSERNKDQLPTTGEKAPALEIDPNPFAAAVEKLPPATRKVYDNIMSLMGEGFKHPEYALAMTFFGLGSMCHKKYVIRPNRESRPLFLNVSVMIIGNSGTGKSTYAQLFDEMQQSLSIDGRYQYLTPGFLKAFNPAASIKMIEMVKQAASPMWRMGEFGASFGAILGNKANTDPAIKTVLDLLSKRWRGATTEPLERSSDGKTLDSVHAPAFNVVADTTRAYLKHGGVKREDIANGLFARFVPFECSDPGRERPAIEFDLDSEGGAEIRTFSPDVLELFNKIRSPAAPEFGQYGIQAKFAPDTDRAALAQLGQKMSDLINANSGDDLAGGFYNRLKDNVAIYAGLMAAAENPDAPQVSYQMFDAAFSVLSVALKTFLTDTREDFGDAPQEQFTGMKAAILIALLKVKSAYDNGGYALVKAKFHSSTKEPSPMLREVDLSAGWISLRHLSRTSAINPQRADKVMIDDAYSELLETEFITRREISPKKGGNPSLYYGLTNKGMIAAQKLLSD